MCLWGRGAPSRGTLDAPLLVMLVSIVVLELCVGAIQSEAAGISATVQLALVDAEWVDHRSLVWVASHGSAGCGAAKVT